jgi:hypothetical protein
LSPLLFFYVCYTFISLSFFPQSLRIWSVIEWDIYSEIQTLHLMLRWQETTKPSISNISIFLFSFYSYKTSHHLVFWQRKGMLNNRSLLHHQLKYFSVVNVLPFGIVNNPRLCCCMQCRILLCIMDGRDKFHWRGPWVGAGHTFLTFLLFLPQKIPHKDFTEFWGQTWKVVWCFVILLFN